MKTQISITTVLMSTLSSAIICFIMSAFHETDSNLVLGTLGVLTTILIGWQIYQIVRIEDFKRQYKTDLHNLEIETSSKIYLNMTNSFKFRLLKETNSDLYCYLYNQLYAIGYFSVRGNRDICNSLISDMECIVKEFKDLHAERKNELMIIYGQIRSSLSSEHQDRINSVLQGLSAS